MNPTRTYQTTRELGHTPKIVFDALITPSQIQGWWSVSRAIVIPRPGGIWCATWGDDEDQPDYISAATIRQFEPPTMLVLGDYQYASTTGPLPFEAEFETTFEIGAIDGGSRLEVTQSGFPVDAVADEHYAGCQVGWQRSLNALEAYLDASAAANGTSQT